MKIGIALLLLLGFFSFTEVAAIRYVNPPFTPWMAWQWLRSRMVSHDAREPFRMPHVRWVRLESISPHLVRAVLAGEDQRFLSHHGFDLVEIQEALEELAATRRMRGASTITMQVARTVFLWPSRTWTRKGLEGYYTVLVELLWSKKRIMEVYLNTVDWGDDIVGADSAARVYFQKSASRLNPTEAALLAAVLPNPHDWSPIHPNEHVRGRQRRILRDMEKMPSTLAGR